MSEDVNNRTEADQVEIMLASDGWKIVKAKMDQAILDLQNINNIDATDPSAVVADIKARKAASELLFNFMKNDVYGFVEQQRAGIQKTVDLSEGTFIDRPAKP